MEREEPTLVLPLSQDCRLARIWLSMADTQESLSSRLWASKCQVCPVKDTMMKSAFSSSARAKREERRQTEAARGPETANEGEGWRRESKEERMKP